MTAYELANELEKVSNDMEHGFVVNDWRLLFESALVLRKQAQEIKALKLRELTDEEIDANRYQWLRNEFANGRETYLAEGIPSGEQLDKYIDEQLKKASEK
jgi:hypothetical protein